MKIEEVLQSAAAKKEYRELVLKYHSDRNPKAEEIIRRINNAKDEGDESLHKLYKELTNTVRKGPIVKEGTDKKILDKWCDEIQNEFPTCYFLVRPDTNGSIYIEIKLYLGNGVETYFMMNAQAIKSKEELIRRVDNKIK